MSVIDILFRVDDICKKYDKYDIDKQRELNAYGDDGFARLYAAVDSTIQQALNKSEAASKETNRAVAAAWNAEVRRAKGRLMDEVPKLTKLVNKKVKGLSSEDIAIRNDLVLALPERILSIPDGITSAASHTGGTSSHPHIKFDSPEGPLDSDYFNQSEESNQFRNEYEMRKIKQVSKISALLHFGVSVLKQKEPEFCFMDEGLDIISEGLDTLKNLALDMNEEIERQVPLMDEMDAKADKAMSDLRNTNLRLKKTITELRSSRNFCIDIILLCVLLGIVMYLYK
ncbi:putative target SNARE coiled-coil domain-containing protein [Medicago truncatula]|uniref:Putative target SNARE coiled-coil domain-containing protein n=1 Tax=Medicago truncatula TaxID=3880 RepID=A0A396JFL1_MEDTR|nr:putative target SNARE coiled-coil domain-containing protein [Medicago truncatula]